MKIYKVINNNMVSIRNNQGCEEMLKGLSIGYKKKPGDVVDENRIEMHFVLERGAQSRRFNEMVVSVDQRIIDVCMDAIAKIKEKSDVKLRDSIYVTLIDHVSGLIDRLKMNITFNNSLLWDIARIYPKEFKLGQFMVKILQSKLPYPIADDEANFIALHIVNAEVANDMDRTYQITDAINDICDIVGSDLGLAYDKNNYYFQRFVMHVRFMLENSASKSALSESGDSQALQSLITDVPEAWVTLQKILKFMNEFLGRELTKDDQLYLMVHLSQLYKQKG